MIGPTLRNDGLVFFYIFVETATPNERQKSIFKTTTDFFLFVVVPKNNLG